LKDAAKSKISLELSEEEALVLFEWLCQLEKKQDPESSTFTAEEIVLLRIQAQLETSLVAPFQEDYKELLRVAEQVVVTSAYSKRGPSDQG